MLVTLTKTEIMQAALAGVMRELMDIRDDGQASSIRGRDPRNGWQLHIVGCLAEMAVAKATGHYWTGLTSYADDVGNFEVHSTMRPDGRLIVNDYDNPAKIFVFVRGGPVHFDVAGWIRAGDAMQDRYWTDPGTGRPAYFVPASDLRPIQHFRKAA